MRTKRIALKGFRMLFERAAGHQLCCHSMFFFVGIQ